MDPLDPPEGGRPAAELLPDVYTELKRLAGMALAGQSVAHTLQPTALAHEVFLRLSVSGATFPGPQPFLAAAAEAMRHVLVDHARRRKRLRRGGGRGRVPLADLPAEDRRDDELLMASDTLDALEAHDPRAAGVARLVVFTGRTVDEAAAALGLSARTAYRDWAYARVWMRKQQLAAEDRP